MSLLLEALKKAERAKEEAQRRAESNAQNDGGLRLAESETTVEPEEHKPVTTRDELPLISQPMDIAAEDLAPAPRAQRAAQPARPASDTRATPQAEPQSADRATARKVFEAKFREPNPRMPFYITMGGLGAFAIGTVVYFYLQLRSPPSLVNLNPPAASQETAGPAPTPTPKAAAAPPAPAKQGIAGLPGETTPGAPATSASATPAATPPVAVASAQTQPAAASTFAPPKAAEPVAKPPAARRAPAAVMAAAPAQSSGARARDMDSSTSPLNVQTTRQPFGVHPRVNAGYQAYLAGDVAASRTAYQQALGEDPSNRDALLGMAALDVRAGRNEAAEAAYTRLLQINPRDAHAQAGLISMRSGRIDPLAAESRVKSLLASNPSAHVLNFTLGNQLAQQGRWPEAQQEYFKAYAAEPDNPDFAYNLAVSLDHLRQPAQAREFYDRAIALAEKRSANFDLASARTRLGQLSR